MVWSRAAKAEVRLMASRLRLVVVLAWCFDASWDAQWNGDDPGRNRTDPLAFWRDFGNRGFALTVLVPLDEGPFGAAVEFPHNAAGRRRKPVAVLSIPPFP
ncbi:hypothetical protein GCM10009864_22770 [Streptomyces lunalinharesii]|uniref:Uncharacterized protein n=1 Tax=Streptomyces lunalinharesii TaxID=333384 RepID=A0ABN3RMJ6_9ACTN